MKITYYHNPQCSKSRAGLEILQAWCDVHHEKFHIVSYLENPPTPQEIQDILQKLGMSAKNIARKKEATEYAIDLAWNEEKIIQALCAHPRAIERPILVIDDAATIGRPSDNISRLLEQHNR